MTVASALGIIGLKPTKFRIDAITIQGLADGVYILKKYVEEIEKDYGCPRYIVKGVHGSEYDVHRNGQLLTVRELG